MSVSTTRRTARLRAALFTSAALATMTIAGAAHAQTANETGAPTGAYLAAQGGASTVDLNIGVPTGAYIEPQGGNTAAVAPEPDIIVANPGTPTTARDPVNITGIGQMVVDAGGGSVTLCTGTLINPRTVLFAAHCVNSAAATAYGANSGGTAIGFGFETNTRANGTGQVDELVAWLFGGGGGPGQYKTNIAQSFYNANYVAYNQFSLEPSARSFLYGDVAIASLDTPAANIPTWALLFSPLPATAVTAAGTGYNVAIDGYGLNGTGQTGQSANVDFRRRAAENILGALTDIKTFETFLFGAPSDASLTQNLYFLDFDDPRRGASGASPFDFNAFRDNARVTNGAPTEGITSEGDSGGPLILQNFSKQLVIGVLSGGYSRFFSTQTPGTYGSVSFYQPLYLYWDWIAANNPYHYVTTVAGNGSWTDPTHWVTSLDPAYNILVGGNVVNGIPTALGEQKNGTTGDFGQTCFQNTTSSDCLDLASGTETVTAKPIGTATDQPADATLSNSGSRGLVNEIKAQDGTESGLDQSALVVVPPATLANGLPGATNFVPNNADPVRTAGTAPKYFDVTLTAAGTTTLSGANITIDRLTIGTANAALVIDSGASLSTLINVNQFAGMNSVNGTLTSTGDYSLFGGAILGTGRINAPFLTSVAGQFAPGTQTTIGTLTIGGNLAMSSGTSFFVNLGAGGTSDKLAVVANGTSTGVASVGGAVIFSPVAGFSIRNNDTYTILTAAGGVSGTFTQIPISAILSPTFTYSANSVSVKVVAGLYANVVSPTAPVQVAYAQLLDQNRAANATGLLSSLFTPLDLQSAATIQATLDSLAPRTETMKNGLALAATDGLERFYAGRISQLGSGQASGTVAIIGQPMSVLSANNLAGAVNTDVGTASPESTVAPANLPEGMNAYLAGGYIQGGLAPMPTATAAPRSKYDGYYLAAGIEKDFGNSGGAGISASYTQLDSDPVFNQDARGRLYQATVYGRTATTGFAVDGQLSGGWFDISTRRAVAIVGTNFTLRTKSRPFAGSGELGLAYLKESDSFKIGPRVSLRGSTISFKDVSESGGGPALSYDRKKLTSIQGRAGLTVSGGKKVQLDLSTYYVHDFDKGSATVGANFVGGTGPNALFAVAGRDQNWVESSISLGVDAGPVRLSVGADATVGREDVSNRTYRGSISFRF